MALLQSSMGNSRVTARNRGKFWKISLGKGYFLTFPFVLVSSFGVKYLMLFFVRKNFGFYP